MAMLGGRCSKCCGTTDNCCLDDVQSVGFLLGEKILSGDLVPGSIYTGLSLTGTYNSGPVRYSLESPPWSFFREDGEYFSSFNASWFLFEREDLGCPVLQASPVRSIILPGVLYEGILPPELLGNSNGQIPRKNSLVVLDVTRNGLVVKPAAVFPINRPGSITTELTSVKFGGVTVTGGDIASRGDRWYAGFFPASRCPISAAECNNEATERDVGAYETIEYYRHDEYVENAEFKGPLEIEFDIYDNYTGLGKIGSGVNVLDWPDLFSIQNCPPCEGACCETDGTCNIKPQCECDTDNGAVFAGVGEGCEACATCNTGQWPFSIDVDVDVSVAPGSEVGLVSDACYSGFKQQLELQSGSYTLLDFYSQLNVDSPLDEEAYAGVFVFDSNSGFILYQCSQNGGTFATATGGIRLMLDFRCETSARVPQQLSSIQFGADLGAGESAPPCNTREQDDVLCPCVDAYSLADRTLRGVGEIAKYTESFVIPAQELQSQKPLENFLSGQFALQAVFPGYILGCFRSPSTQQKKTHIANVTVTIQAAGNPNPLP